MSKAYLVFEVDVTDEETYDKYREVGAPLMEEMGGKVLAGSGRRQTLDGDRAPQKLFVVEFADYDTALRFHQSDAYQGVIGIRNASSVSRTYLLEGV